MIFEQEDNTISSRLRTSESELMVKLSPPVSVENPPIATTPTRPKIQEEKWTPVSSKKTSKANKVNKSLLSSCRSWL